MAVICRRALNLTRPATNGLHLGLDHDVPRESHDGSVRGRITGWSKIGHLLTQLVTISIVSQGRLSRFFKAGRAITRRMSPAAAKTEIVSATFRKRL